MNNKYFPVVFSYERKNMADKEEIKEMDAIDDFDNFDDSDGSDD